MVSCQMNICNFCFSFDYNIGSNFSFHMKLHFLSNFKMFCIISIKIHMDIIAKYIENSCRMVSEKPENFSIKYYIFLVFSHKKRPPLWWLGDRQNPYALIKSSFQLLSCAKKYKQFSNINALNLLLITGLYIPSSFFENITKYNLLIKIVMFLLLYPH